MPSDAPLPAESLAELRARIDEVDTRLLAAVSERAEIARLVGEAKLAADPDAGGQPVHRPAREAMLIRSLIARYRGPMNLHAIHAIWRELIGASIGIQKAMTIATADSAADLAARQHFGASQYYTWAASPIADVKGGQADIALFSVMDAGAWTATADLLAARDDCTLLWRLPFTMPGAPWVAVGRGIADDSGMDLTVALTDSENAARHPAVETLCALPDGRAVIAVAGAFDNAMLESILSDDDQAPAATVQRLGQWPAALEI